MQEVSAFPHDASVDASHATALLVPILRTFLFAAQRSLLAFESLVLVFEVEAADHRAVRVVGVLDDAHVDADHILTVNLVQCEVLGRVSFGFDAEGGVPLARFLLLDRDLFHAGVVGDGTVEMYRHLTYLGKGEASLVTRVLEFETRLVVGETSILSR